VNSGSPELTKALHISLPDEVIAAQARISMLIQRTVHAIANHDFPGARRYSYEERLARDELRRLRQKFDIDDSGNDGCL
jgi:ATP-dependent Clp protease ATP-binding subunit ClpC